MADPGKRISRRFSALVAFWFLVVLVAACTTGGDSASNPLFRQGWLNFLNQPTTNPEPTPVPGDQGVNVGIGPVRSTQTIQPSINSTGSPNRTATSTPQKIATVKASELKGMRVLLLHPWPGAQAQGFQNLVDEFNRSNAWGIRVDVAAPGSPSEVAAWMVDALGSPATTPANTPTVSGLSNPPKEIPAIVVADPVQAQTWQADKPVLENLAGYLVDPTWGLRPQDAADLQPVAWFGAPAQRSAVFIIYNQTWAKSLGFDHPPATLDEFRQQACKAYQANRYDPDPQRRGTGGWLITDDPLSLAAWLNAFSGQIRPDTSGRYLFDTPVVSQALRYLKGLQDSNCAWIGRDALPYDYFAGREALFYLGSLDDLADQQSAMLRSGHSDQWTAIPFPVATGKPFVMADNYDFYLVKSTPPREVASWLFIRWMLAPEQQVRWIKVINTFPVGQSVAETLGGFRVSNPQWAAVFDLLPAARSQPDQAAWAVDGGVLSDGAQQIFQADTTADAIPGILQQIDQTTQELHQTPAAGSSSP